MVLNHLICIVLGVHWRGAKLQAETLDGEVSLEDTHGEAERAPGSRQETGTPRLKLPVRALSTPASKLAGDPGGFAANEPPIP
jgi:hypothetical protein